jgi:hypothetical protein
MTDLTFDQTGAQSEIDKINADPAHDYWQQNGARHDKAVEHMRELHGIVHGDEPAIHDDPNMTSDLEALMEEAMLPPDDPSGYDFNEFKSGNSDWDAKAEADFRQIFHAADLSQPEAAQLLTIASQPVPDQAETISQLKAKYDGDDAALHRDLYAARAAVRQIGGGGLIDYLNKTGLADHPVVIQMAIRKALEMGIEA